MNIIIDGRECSCERGEFLLQVARRNGIFVPSLCYHEGLGGLAACRVCIVEILERDRRRIVASCIYPIENEIEVFTQSDAVLEQRGIVLTLLARLAPGARVIQQMARANGVEIPLLTDKKDGDTCILCGRCTTACDLLGSGAIAKINRGITKVVDTPYSKASLECIGCASCAQVCPTDSIPFTETESTVNIWGRTFELQTCERCGCFISTDELIAKASLLCEVADAGEAYSAGEAPDAGAVPDAEATHEVDATLCSECRRQAIADTLRIGFKP